MQIRTRSTGSKHFGIKPYPLLVTNASVSKKKGEALLFSAYTKWHVPAENGKFRVEPEHRYGFNPLDVVITDAIKRWLDEEGYNLPELALDRYTMLQKGLHTSDDGVVRRYKEEGVMVVEESECPAFKRYWNPDTSECQACKKHFPDEYFACKKICEKKAQDKTKPQKPTSSETPDSEAEPEESLETALTSQSNQSASSFKGFRKGSRAQVLIDYFAATGSVSFSEAAQHLATSCDIGLGKAMENVKGYVSEWKNGKWSGKVMDFPFTITADKETIRYQEG